MKVIGIIVVVLTGMFIGSIWNAFVLCKMWAWFITPFFHIPTPSLVYAIGIAMTVGFLTKQVNLEDNTKTKGTDKILQSISFSFLHPLLVLTCGWVVSLFI